MTRKAPLIDELRERRQALGWSIKELGDRCGIDERFLDDWESGIGSPRLDAVESWASSLGLRLAFTAVQSEARTGLNVDWVNRRVAIDGTPVRLTPMEWKALERLAAAPGELVTHQALFQHLYGGDRAYRAESTAIRVLITKLRRLLPLRIEAQWGRGYVLSGIAPSVPSAANSGGREVAEPAKRPSVVEPISRGRIAPLPPPAPQSPARLLRELVERSEPGIRPPPRAVPPARPAAHRAEELMTIERFLAERGVTRCPDVATIQKSPLPTLVWDKVKRKWVRPSLTDREAG